MFQAGEDAERRDEGGIACKQAPIRRRGADGRRQATPLCGRNGSEGEGVLEEGGVFEAVEGEGADGG